MISAYKLQTNPFIYQQMVTKRSRLWLKLHHYKQRRQAIK